MSSREVKASYGLIRIDDASGIRLTIDDGDNRGSVPLTSEAAKELGEILIAFAIVNSPNRQTENE